MNQKKDRKFFLASMDPSSVQNFPSALLELVDFGLPNYISILVCQIRMYHKYTNTIWIRTSFIIVGIGKGNMAVIIGAIIRSNITTAAIFIT